MDKAFAAACLTWGAIWVALSWLVRWFTGAVEVEVG